MYHTLFNYALESVNLLYVYDTILLYVYDAMVSHPPAPSILTSSYVVHTGLELAFSASAFLVLACWGCSVDYHTQLLPLFITSREYSLSMREIPRPMTIKIGP